MKIDFKAIVQAVIVSLLLALCTGAFKTYMAVHDLQRDVQVLQKQNEMLRAELTDLWQQASDQFQAVEKKRGRPKP